MDDNLEYSSFRKMTKFLMVKQKDISAESSSIQRLNLKTSDSYYLLQKLATSHRFLLKGLQTSLENSWKLEKQLKFWIAKFAIHS